MVHEVLENADSCQALKGQAIKKGMDDEHQGSFDSGETKRDEWWPHEHQRSFVSGRYEKG